MRKLITYYFIVMSVSTVHSYASKDDQENDKSSYSYRSTTKEITKPSISMTFSATDTPVSITGQVGSYKVTETTRVSPKDEELLPSSNNGANSNDNCTAF